ncbi:MAG TPA: hypothetical protein VM841_07960 [Actinomycetota bacterium]|nr:hypothetical protein [Actinomycetota bacterium]
MATTQDPNATPGTLKAALVLWMALMAGLLGYSIATADPNAADDHKKSESSESHGEEKPAGDAGHDEPAASPEGEASPH